MNRNPIPLGWRIVAAAVIFVGYGLLEWQDAHTEKLIAAADRQRYAEVRK